MNSLELDWPAAGFADTELGVLMGPEVGYGTTEVYDRGIEGLRAGRA
jgi:hypothetical protein